MHAQSRTEHRADKFVHRVASDVLRIAGAAGLAQVLALLAAPVLTRLYDPDMFGHFAFFGALVTILTPLASLRYEWALPLPKDDSHAHHLFALCLALVGCSSLIVAFIDAIASPIIARWADVSGSVIGLLPVAIFVLGLHTVVTGWLVRERAFAQLARVRFVTIVGTVVCQLGLGLLHASVTNLILGFIGGYIVGLILASCICSRAFVAAAASVHLSGIRRVAAEYRAFAILTSPAGVINAMGSQLPNLLLPSLYGPVITGQYSLAQRVLGQPQALVGQAANQVLWGIAPRLITEEPARLWPLFVRLNAGLLALMMPALVLTWFGAEVFSVVFGPAWGQAGSFAGILVVASLLGLAAQGTTGLHVYRLNHWMCAWELMQLIMTLVTLGAALEMSWSPKSCIIAIALAFAASSVILLALNGFAVRRLSYRGCGAAVANDPGTTAPTAPQSVAADLAGPRQTRKVP
jgi:O-antigen/teichoic acid export membrane protein